MCEYVATDSSKVHRNSDFASYNKEVVWNLIDGAPYCHVSATVNGRPYIQPTVHWREDEKLYIHGALKNKMIKAIVKGAEAAIAFTHFDAYIMTASAINHGVSYRSATMFAKGRGILDLDEKERALRLFIERLSPGRWATIRPPTQDELKMTGVVEFPIQEVSAKIMMQGDQVLWVLPGGKYEIAEDKDINAWTGVYPYTLMRKDPLTTEELRLCGDA